MNFYFSHISPSIPIQNCPAVNQIPLCKQRDLQLAALQSSGVFNPRVSHQISTPIRLPDSLPAGIYLLYPNSFLISIHRKFSIVNHCTRTFCNPNSPISAAVSHLSHKQYHTEHSHNQNLQTDNNQIHTILY